MEFYILHSLTFYLFVYRIPFQQSGYIPLEAGKYYWIEALHKEGARRDSLSVGYTLECPNAPSVLSEKPILKPSLQYKIPRECCCSSVTKFSFSMAFMVSAYKLFTFVVRNSRGMFCYVPSQD